MSVVLNYNRYFNKATAKRGEYVDITFNVSFISPPSPSVNCWFQNIGDNLGGSKVASGPLHWDSKAPTTITNLDPAAWNFIVAGSYLRKGLIRFYYGNDLSYPQPTTPLSEVWKPLLPNTITGIRFVHRFQVVNEADLGTIIDVPTRSTPCNNSNWDPNEMMIDLGSDMTLRIIDGAPPSGSSRTLTIVE